METTVENLHTISAARLMHEPVRNLNGEHVGRIEDYMIDVEAGCIDYAILSFGGFLGMGSKLYVIPWTLLQIDTDTGGFAMDVTREQVERAPSYDHGNAPDLADGSYVRQVFGFWGVDYPSSQAKGRPMMQGQARGMSDVQTRGVSEPQGRVTTERQGGVMESQGRGAEEVSRPEYPVGSGVSEETRGVAPGSERDRTVSQGDAPAESEPWDPMEQ